MQITPGMKKCRTLNIKGKRVTVYSIASIFGCRLYGSAIGEGSLGAWYRSSSQAVSEANRRMSK